MDYFAARRGWITTLSFCTAGSVIEVFHRSAAHPRRKSPRFEAHGALAHNRVRRQMRVLVSGDEPVNFLGGTASNALTAARRINAGLGERVFVQQGPEKCVLTWMGDCVNDALVLLLAQFGLEATNDAIALTMCADEERTREVLSQIADWDVEDAALFLTAEVPPSEKWDWALPKEPVGFVLVVRVRCGRDGGLAVKDVTRLP